MGEVDPDEDTMCAAGDLDTRSVIAWGLDDDDFDESRRWFTPGRITALAVAVSLAVIGASAAVVVFRLHSSEPVAESAPLTIIEPAKVEAPVVMPTTQGWLPKPDRPPPPPPPAPPAKTVTIQASSPPMIAEDYQFIDALVTKWGWTIKNRDILLRNAVLVCKELQQGHDLPEISQALSSETGDMSVSDAHVFASEVLLNYSGCRAR